MIVLDAHIWLWWVAAETLTNTGLVVLAGEITSTANVDYIQVARNTIKRIGYDNTEYGIDYKGCAVLVAYDKQSPDIAQGVDRASDDFLNQGACDQGLMFASQTALRIGDGLKVVMDWCVGLATRKQDIIAL